MISFLLWILFLLKNAIVFKKATVSQCFFFLSIHSDAFLQCFFGSTYVYLLEYFSLQKNFCFCLMEVPHYGRKCQILSKTMLSFFFSKVSSMIWFGLFSGHKWQKPQLKWSIVWSIFDGSSGQKKASSLFGQYFNKTTTVAWETWRFLT